MILLFPSFIQSKRGTRRRRRLSQSSSPEAESHSPLKNPPPSKYPPEYPVGKVAHQYMCMYMYCPD